MCDLKWLSVTGSSIKVFRGTNIIPKKKEFIFYHLLSQENMLHFVLKSLQWDLVVVNILNHT